MSIKQRIDREPSLPAEPDLGRPDDFLRISEQDLPNPEDFDPQKDPETEPKIGQH